MKIFYVFFVLSSLLSIDAKADPLRDLAGSFCDHLEEEYNRRNTYAKQFPTENNKGAAQIAQYNFEYGLKLQNDTESYLNNKLTPNQFLYDLLFTRSDFLQKRRKNYINATQELNSTGTLQRAFLATHPATVALFKEYAAKDPANITFVRNYNSVLYLIDMYQVHSKIIVEVFNRHSLNEFSDKTLTLLRASVTLHPLLRGESDDWLHPDYAFISQKDEPKHLFLKRDLNYYDDYVEVDARTIQMMNWTRAYTEIYATKAEVGQCKLELPPLSSLRRTGKEEVIEPTENLPESKPEEIKKETKPTKKKKKNKKGLPFSAQLPMKSSEIEKDFRSKSKSEQLVSKEMESKRLPVVLDLTNKNTQSLPLPDVTNVTHSQATTSAKKKPNSNQNVLPSKNEFLVSRGNRLFHNQRVIKSIPTVALPNKLQNIVDCLFHYQQFQTVSFGEFAAVWRHINGEKSIKAPGSGGSHRALLNSLGQVVGSTFAHDDKQTYGAKTVKYLRDALMNVGVNPSK